MLSSVGVVISAHYCQGKLDSISIFKQSKACCTNSNCCHDEILSFQFDEDYVVQDLQSLKKVSMAQALVSFIDFHSQYLWNNKSLIAFININKSPPLVSDIPIRIQCLLI